MRRLLWVAGVPAEDAAALVDSALMFTQLPAHRVVRLAGNASPAGGAERLRQLALEPGDVIVSGEVCRLQPAAGGSARGLVPIATAESFRMLKPTVLLLLEFWFTPAGRTERYGELTIMRRDPAQLAALRELRQQQELLRAYAASLCAASGCELARLAADRANLRPALEQVAALLKHWLE